ncbi:unnamed protein product [Phytophthora lilii]|uniref:Unnamed protein product n=1 Tax=Phytophthora lilii TaxID=2077276 RepID=A0A9W6U7J8_9STRA|nr:unnamed protein product [Phytophthora lilii]
MTGRTDTPWTPDPSSSGPSAELEKLLADGTDASTYDAETMVDELLTSTWEPIVPISDAKGRHASFSQQTTALNALQSVLAESIDRLVQHRKVVSDRIADLERDSRQASRTFQGGLAKPDLLLSVGV